MPFPESKRVIYQQNPLVEVICQLRFPTILEIAATEPAAFQKKIRSTYPLYEKDEGGINFPKEAPKEILEALSQLTSMRPVEHLTHKFLIEDSARLISLNREFVAVTETQYKQWEHFREEIFRAKAALEEIYEPAFYTRIGLRYRDIIDREELGLTDTPWNSLINASLSGVLVAEAIYHQVEEIQSEALIKIDDVEGGHVKLRHGLARRINDKRQVYQ